MHIEEVPGRGDALSYNRTGSTGYSEVLGRGPIASEREPPQDNHLNRS